MPEFNIQFKSQSLGVFRVISAFLIVVLATSFSAGLNGQFSFRYLNSEITGVTFENKCIETPTRCIYQYDYFYNGGGVALADFNNDGFTDIFFTGNDVPNRLYQNSAQGNLTFIDVSKKAESPETNGIRVLR
jgi:NADH dehydrogenase FAD-containing subunit